GIVFSGGFSFGVVVGVVVPPSPVVLVAVVLDDPCVFLVSLPHPTAPSRPTTTASASSFFTVVPSFLQTHGAYGSRPPGRPDGGPLIRMRPRPVYSRKRTTAASRDATPFCAGFPCSEPYSEGWEAGGAGVFRRRAGINRAR